VHFDFFQKNQNAPAGAYSLWGAAPAPKGCTVSFFIEKNEQTFVRIGYSFTFVRVVK